MKTNHKIVLGVLLGIAVGFAFSASIHARQMKKAPGYVVAEVDVTDPATFQKYAEKTPGTLAPFNGQYIIRGGKNNSIEGEPPKRFVVIQFESMEKAQAAYTSPAYMDARKVGDQYAKLRIFAVEGVAL